MRYKAVPHLSLQASDEDKFNFELAWLRERVRNLELIVHELLRDRINKDLADSWVHTAHDKGKSFTPALNQIEGQGQRIAALLDVWPAAQFTSSQWQPKPAPKAEGES